MSTKTKDADSKHDEGHDLEHGDGHGHDDHHHSHLKTYMIAGAILTAITVVEVASVEIDALSETMKVILILVTAIAKFAGVVAVFMHLQDDRNIFRILFVSPLIVAIAMIVVVTNMSERNYAPFLGKDNQPKIVEELMKEPKPLPNEKLEEMYAAQADFNKGKEHYKANCIACHGPAAGGQTGPNLTDPCWIHGGDLKSIVNTLNKGVLAKGMPAWKPVLGQEGVYDVAFYIRSIQNTNPADAKACEGEKYTPKK